MVLSLFSTSLFTTVLFGNMSVQIFYIIPTCYYLFPLKVNLLFLRKTTVQYVFLKSFSDLVCCSSLLRLQFGKAEHVSQALQHFLLGFCFPYLFLMPVFSFLRFPALSLYANVFPSEVLQPLTYQ